MIWIASALLTATVVALILVPLLRHRGAQPARAAYDLAVYRDQLAEIDRDLERGVLTGDQAESARIEVQRRLLTVADAAKAAAPAAKPRRPVVVALVVALAVPGLAFGLYALLGSPRLPDQPYAGRAAQIQAEKNQAAQFQGMVDRLAARLARHPEDGAGWAMLGRSLAVLGQADKASEAYEKALPLLPDNAQVRMEYAALLLDEQPDAAPFPPRFVAVMKEALAIDGENPRAIYFVGLAEAQAGHTAAARALLTKLLAKLPPDSPEHAEVADQLGHLKD